MRDFKKRRNIRHFRIRKKVFGTETKPRLSVFVSNKHFYAQIINDETSHTLVAYSTLNLSNFQGNNQKIVVQIGKMIALLAIKKRIKKVVFDRGGFLFHGKVKAFADAARKNGLEF